MTTLLVANRSEIALRIFRTAKRMGMRTVAVYSDADAQAPHARAADVAVRIGPAPAADSYLSRDRILAAAKETGAELIHPGYGFLAEDARLAKDCEDHGFTFVGPPSKVLAEVGDKVAVRRIAAEAGVPMLPSYHGDNQSDEAFARAANDVGYPVLVKPAAGGGGKGMTVVEAPADLTDALASSRRVARAAFDDDRLLLERYLVSPRHVEVQVMADAHGGVVHLGERDCSLQRRHQKLMEETPAPNLDRTICDELCRAAVALASLAGYVGAGTCEFLVGSDGTFGFIEMNARLQVEHPVTELVTGLDLVELQLRVALGERLPMKQDNVRHDGHAIEVRIYAEDPESGFLPQSGRVLHTNWPDHARIDTGIEEGTDVTPFYDPLLAKLVVHGSDRTSALWELHRALDRVEILGPLTNVTFLNAITRDLTVVEGDVTTDWLERAYADWHTPSASTDVAVAVAAAAEADRLYANADRDPWTRLGPWRVGTLGAARIVLRPGGEERALTVAGTGPFIVDGTITVKRGNECHEWRIGTDSAAAARTDDAWLVWSSGAAHEIPVGPATRRPAGAGPSRLGSPLPGQVIAVCVAPGQQVESGDELVIVEAMKMEHAIRAPSAGSVRAVLCAPGDRVDRGQSLVDFEPT